MAGSQPNGDGLIDQDNKADFSDNQNLGGASKCFADYPTLSDAAGRVNFRRV